MRTNGPRLNMIGTPRFVHGDFRPVPSGRPVCVPQRLAAAMHVLGSVALVMAVAIVPTAPAAAQPAFNQLRIIAPAAPGGGWDQTARVMQQVLQRTGVVRTPIVENIPGAAGTIGLARFIGSERGNGEALMVSGLIMLGGIVTHHSPVTLADVVPIARIS